MAVKKQYSSFAEMLNAARVPVLVDFYATWCGPCQIMAKVIEHVNNQMSGRIQVVKIDIDRYPKLASQYQIHALPTLVLFQGEKPIHRVEGVVQPQQLIHQLQNFL